MESNFSFLKGNIYLGSKSQTMVFRISKEGRYAKYKHSEIELTLRQGNIHFKK